MTKTEQLEVHAEPSPSRPRIVAILESSAKMGGIQHTTLALASRIDRTQWNPVVICPEEGELVDACHAAGVEVQMLPVLPMWSTSVWIGDKTKIPNPFAWLWNAGTIWGTANSVAAFLRKSPPDLVITKGLLCHFYGGIAARKAKIPCLWYVQDFISVRFGGIYTTVFGMMAARVPTAVAAIGPQIVRQLSKAMQSRARVVYNAVDTTKFRNRNKAAATRIREEWGIGRETLVIGNAARLTPWKGQHHLLEAFGRLSSIVPNAHLVLVGGSLFGDQDYERRLRRRVEDLGLASRVIFAGHRADMKDVLSAMDIFAYCSVEKDICPLSLLEAMSAGLPIAAFDIEGVKEALTDNSDALLVRNGDEEALFRALHDLIGDPELRARVGKSARERAEKQFSMESHVLRMQQTLDEVLAGR
ncbi:MAG TPA: glycosyltransferase family 4 protein [Bryobacteraceae bacterium]|jgi:glycosyltransferase involved in cell wall biosynthesis